MLMLDLVNYSQIGFLSRPHFSNIPPLLAEWSISVPWGPILDWKVLEQGGPS